MKTERKPDHGQFRVVHSEAGLPSLVLTALVLGCGGPMAGIDGGEGDAAPPACMPGSANIAVIVGGLDPARELPLQDATVADQSSTPTGYPEMTLELSDATVFTIGYVFPAAGTLPLTVGGIVQVELKRDLPPSETDWEPSVIVLRASEVDGAGLIAAFWASFGEVPAIPEVALAYQSEGCAYALCGPTMSTQRLEVTESGGAYIAGITSGTEATAGGFMLGNGVSWSGSDTTCSDSPVRWVVGYVVPEPPF